MSREEVALSQAFDAFRSAMRSFIAAGTKRKRRAGSFAVEILGKRLLSCPVAFAESWRRCREGLADAETAGGGRGRRRASQRRARDGRRPRDPVARGRRPPASSAPGSRTLPPTSRTRSRPSTPRIADLGLDCGGADVCEQTPRADARFDALLSVIERLLRTPDGEWRDDERLVVFTEYKTTLDYLLRRLRERYEPERILTLFGGMDEVERDRIKQAFNDPAEPVRVLLATDAASEGLNLQRTARYLLHFDCPWNPSQARAAQRAPRPPRPGARRAPSSTS